MSKKKEETVVVNNRSNTTFFNDSSLIDDDQNNNYDEFNYEFNDYKTETELKIELSINIYNFLMNYVSESDNFRIIPLCEYLNFNRIKEHLEFNNV